MAPVLIELIERATGHPHATGIIRNRKIAFQGETSEDVRVNIERRQFGIMGGNETSGDFVRKYRPSGFSFCLQPTPNSK